MTMVFDDHCAEIADLLNDDFLGNDLDAFISELESGDEAIAFADGAMLVDGISLVPSEAAQCGATHRVSSSPPPSIAQPTGDILKRDAPEPRPITTVAEALLMPLLAQLGPAAPPPPSRREAKAARAYRKQRLVEKRRAAKKRNHTHYEYRRNAAKQRTRVGGRFQKKHHGAWLSVDERRTTDPALAVPAPAASRVSPLAVPAAPVLATSPPHIAMPAPLQAHAQRLNVPLVPLPPRAPIGVPFLAV